MNNQLFEQIYYGEKEKMSEGFEQFLQYMPLSRISPTF